MNSKTRNMINWIFASLVALIFIGGGLFNFSGAPATVGMAKGVGGHTNLILLGALEIISAILFLIPRTGILGTMLLIAYMGGAIAIHFVNGLPILFPTIIQILLWVSAAMRFPELTTRLKKSKLNYISKKK